MHDLQRESPRLYKGAYAYCFAARWLVQWNWERTYLPTYLPTMLWKLIFFFGTQALREESHSVSGRLSVRGVEGGDGV